MAATAAVKGSNALHTSMIRIASQWLAACSVLAIFDLDQLQILSFGNQQTAPPPSFPWPKEVTNEMQWLFDFLSITPKLLSVDMATHCAAEKWYPQLAYASNMAFGLYHVCSPVLLIIGIIICSLVTVHVVVPRAQRFGVFFNEAAEQQNKRSKALKTLRPSLEPTLSEIGLEWDDLEEAGALKMSTASLYKACEEVEVFVRDALLKFPKLLLEACKHEAQMEGLDVELSEAKVSQIVLTPEIRQLKDVHTFLHEINKHAAWLGTFYIHLLGTRNLVKSSLQTCGGTPETRWRFDRGSVNLGSWTLWFTSRAGKVRCFSSSLGASDHLTSLFTGQVKTRSLQQ